MPNLTLADKEFDLKVTMHRLKLLKEVSGVDLLNPGASDGSGLQSAEHMIAAAYAFAGGEATGMTQAEFEDLIGMADLPAVSAALEDVMTRDVGENEGNAEAGST